jgi:hypothetical protein
MTLNPRLNTPPLHNLSRSLQKTAKELASILRIIPKNITSLNLAANGLHCYFPAEHVIIFKAIPKNITFLDLKNNIYGRKTKEELITIFKSLPPNISSLDLSDNFLHEKTIQELAMISRNIPFVIEIRADDISLEKLAALNRYNGSRSIKQIDHALESKLPQDLSAIVLSYLTGRSEKSYSQIWCIDK